MFLQQDKINSMINKNDHILVGVSGGPDSMGLLKYIIDLQTKYNLTISVAHVNHHTRGNENTYEENLIRNYCAYKKIPFYVGNFINSGKENFHEEARKFRYQFFIELCRKTGANKIALAHHQDDLVETILFKIVRGNHISGYIGMKEITSIDDDIVIIRPFLYITKNEIIAYCEENGVPYAIDSSNLSNKYTRNYIRHEIIPLIKNIQPDFNHKIIQLQEQLLEVTDYLQIEAKTISKEMIKNYESDRIILDLNKLQNVHKALIRFIILNVVNELYKETFELTYEKMTNLFNIIFNKKPNITFDLGKNIYCIKEYDNLIFQIGIKDVIGYEIIIDEFKEYKLPNGLRLNIKKVKEKAKINNKTLILCYNSTVWPLKIRSRKNGDFINTKIGKKKVSRVFIDNKIPVSLRKNWPLVVDNKGNILWVIGLQKPDLSISMECNEYIRIDIID
ncbi:MAG TPA: tRNA lysidine(34) synthetase TilS [Haloplasmataceae bacterium]